MKSLLFNIINFIPVFSLLFLFIMLSSTNEFKKLGTHSDDYDGTDIYNANNNIELHAIDVDYINFKNYTLNEIEKNNQDIIEIEEEINEMERLIEEASAVRINNLKQQNTRLNEELNSYQTQTNNWQSFKSNFKTNFKRMGLPFSELFPNKAKQ